MIAGLKQPVHAAGLLLALLPALLCGITGCAPDRSDETTTKDSAKRAASLVEFPAELRTDDPVVNAFIEHAIAICVSEDYDAFRLLWSALEEPLGEQEFRVGFRAARKITILHLEKRRTRKQEIVYLVHCLIELDPNRVPESRRDIKPQRDVVLLLRKEGDQWRIATPPRKETRALKTRFAQRRKANIDTNGAANEGPADSDERGDPGQPVEADKDGASG